MVRLAAESGHSAFAPIADIHPIGHPLRMNVFRASTNMLPMAALLLLLTGCDPGVHVAYEKSFEGPIDLDCVDRALQSVARDVRRTTYQSATYKNRGFPPGTMVDQFNYSGPNLDDYSLDVATLPNRQIHYWHGWSKIGTRVPVAEQRRILPLLIRANDVVGRQCGLSFANVRPMIGNG